MEVPRRQLSLRKGDHTYAFSFPEGEEGALLAALLDLADDKRWEFDWFDAAALSYEMGRPLTAEVKTP